MWNHGENIFILRQDLFLKLKFHTQKNVDYDHYKHINHVKQMCANSFVK